LTRPIRTVKREIRIIGLDTCKKRNVFGAVVRGGLFLDGVIKHHLGEHTELGLAAAVLGTKYYPELRAIMLHDPGQYLEGVRLETMAKLPVMEVSRMNQPQHHYSLFKSEHGTLYHRSRLPRSVADRILSFTWQYGALPEPARIAHLLSRV
jgi:endonuclease V-like protein UPF0215 family